MPIDLKGLSLEKSAANSFCQSNSLYSFNNPKTCAKFNLAGSKSSNCLTDGLIEDEELIDKLFPKCRPKSKTTAPNSSSAKSDRTNGCVSKGSAAEMLNTSGNSSSAITEQTGNGPASGDARKTTARKSGFQAYNYPSLQSRRIWNFMDISPSPSPPPLSPIENMPDLGSTHHFDHHDPCDPLADKLAPFTPTQERPSPVGQYQQPSSYERDSFKSKSRFDINSLEVNRPVFEKPVELAIAKPNASGSAAIFSKSGSYFSSNDGVEKSARSQTTNHKHAGAHFRLDSLLLSPDEQHRDMYTVTKLPNGIKKANRFPLDCDLEHDEDDVLFSRINPPIQTPGSVTNANLRIASKTLLKESNVMPSNTYLIDSSRPRDRSTDTACHNSQTLPSNRENSVESTRSKSKPREESDNCLLAGKVQSSCRTLKEDNISDNEAMEEERDGGKCAGRNRIELAGGKEIFSSSRSGRSKRRSSSHAGGSSGKLVNSGSAGAVPSEPRGDRRGSFISRHTQLYSVSMAADCEQQHSVSSNVVASQVADDEERPATQERLSELRSQQTQSLATTLGNDSPVVTGNQDHHSVRAQIYQPITTPATVEANQRPESIPSNLTANTKPTEGESAETAGCHPATSTLVKAENEAKANESHDIVSHDCLAHPLEICNSTSLARSHMGRELSHNMDIASSLYKSTMTFEDEAFNNPRMSSRDIVTIEQQEPMPLSASTENTRHPLEHYNGSEAVLDRPEFELGRSNRDVQQRHSRPLPVPEQDLCRKLEQSVSLSCDQFARDLKKRLDKVSNGNSIDAQPEDEVTLANETVDMESDNNSVKSASLSAQSFEANERIARVIGSVPIAQYEGSPKRYGPKPGYPKRVLSTSSNNSNDYETIPSMKAEPTADDIGHKSAALSSENGSPQSTHSSTSSATFSSTDIHSSSSFSCPSNQKSNGFSNWNIQSRLKETYDSPSNDFSQHQSDTCDEGCLSTTRKVIEPNFPPQMSNDEIVKTILSLPSGQIDTEDDVDEDVTSSSDKPAEMGLNDVSLSGRVGNEPIYSSIASSGYSADPNKSSGYSSKRSLHSDDSESVTKSKTSITSNGCDRNLNRSATSLKAPSQTVEMATTTSSSSAVRSQIESSVSGKSNISQQASETTRNVPKTLRLENNYPRYLEASQSFESTDSSYRSEQCPSKEFYYGQSDDDLYMFGQKNDYLGKPVSGSAIRLNGGSNEGRNLLEPAKGMPRSQLSYTCLSPELSTQEGKLCVDSTYELAEYPSDNCESYSDTVTNNKTDAGSCGRIKAMPVLEDGLSSGMPSSDEMDYDDEDEAEEDLMTHEHDLDEYVNEYNNSRSVPCDSMLPGQFNANRLDQMVNGSSSNCANYGFHYKQQAPNDFARPHKTTEQQSQPLYRCSTKTGAPFGLEMTEEMPHQSSVGKKDSTHEFYNGHHHHHHPNHHLHNHPIMDDNSRTNLSSPYENGKHLPNTQSQDVAFSHDKFCISSQLRSISNSSSNNSSMSTVRNAAGQLGPSGAKASTSPPPPAPSHHHYHHYYHNHQAGNSLQQPLGTRQNYPNLSSSPTSLSPNSPGGIHHQSSASSSSSSSHPASAAPHHYHQQQAAAASQSQEMAAATSPSSSIAGIAAPNVRHHHDEDCDTDQETDRLLGSQRNDDRGYYDEKAQLKRSSTSREAFPPKVLIEGVLFRARYLGSTQLVCDGQPTKATRMMQAEEAVSRIKAPEGETQPSTEVDLFISTEKIMVLNTDLKEIMMDHALRTISYIADIGDLLVLMARRRTPIDDPTDSGIKRIPKMICHVFESEEAQYIAQSIGQAFQVAYMEFLKANGIEDSSFLKEMDYQEVLNSQEIFGNELEMFAKREKQKEVIVPKQKGEILGIVIVESGWGSMLPTVVIANMAQSSPSARCGQLNIGDQIIAINGISLVGLPLSTCQAYVKNTKNQTAVKFTIVPCAPVVEVKIKRPDTKYQLGFSVQNGVICSLLRGGIAERGGVRVGHRIIEINGQSVVAVPHDRIVNLLATSVGEIHMKTMPTSMFRLLTGQDSPSYM